MYSTHAVSSRNVVTLHHEVPFAPLLPPYLPFLSQACSVIAITGNLHISNIYRNCCHWKVNESLVYFSRYRCSYKYEDFVWMAWKGSSMAETDAKIFVSETLINDVGVSQSYWGIFSRQWLCLDGYNCC
jgi:hypothetical protein